MTEREKHKLPTCLRFSHARLAGGKQWSCGSRGRSRSSGYHDQNTAIEFATRGENTPVETLLE